ncbi:MAG: hypothetical protein WED00_11625 [Aquisalimonadaceae bacterium]
MITVITRFPQPSGSTPADVKNMFEQSAPRYQAVPGLVRKHYYLGDDGRCGGVYLFHSRADAERLFDAAFEASIKERFGGLPEVEYLQTLVIVDNAAGTIEDVTGEDVQ